LYDNDRDAVYTHPDLTRNRLTQLSLNLRHEIDSTSEVSGLLYLRNSRRNTINGDEAEEEDGEFNASFNQTKTKQRGYGAAAAYSRKSGAHQWQVGSTI